MWQHKKCANPEKKLIYNRPKVISFLFFFNNRNIELYKPDSDKKNPKACKQDDVEKLKKACKEADEAHNMTKDERTKLLFDFSNATPSDDGDNDDTKEESSPGKNNWILNYNLDNLQSLTILFFHQVPIRRIMMYPPRSRKEKNYLTSAMVKILKMNLSQIKKNPKTKMYHLELIRTKKKC